MPPKRKGGKRKLAEITHSSEADFVPSDPPGAQKKKPTAKRARRKGGHAERRSPDAEALSAALGSDSEPEQDQDSDGKSDRSSRRSTTEPPRISMRLKGKIPNYTHLAGLKKRGRRSPGASADSDADDEPGAGEPDIDRRPQTSSSLSQAFTLSSPSVHPTAVDEQMAEAPSPSKSPASDGSWAIELSGPSSSRGSSDGSDAANAAAAAAQLKAETKAAIVNAADECSGTETDGDQDVADFKQGLLRAIQALPPGEYSTCQQITPSNFTNPCMRIHGLPGRSDFGPLGYPLQPARLRELVAYGREQWTAQYGPWWHDGGHDPTFVFGPEQVEFANPEWQTFVQCQADDASNRHGNNKYPVRAELQSLRVWTKDSLWRGWLHAPKNNNKSEGTNHFATMLILLPSKHRGGNFILSSITNTTAFETAGLGPAYISSMVPVNCDPLPLASGFRVGLVYNLVVRPPDPTLTSVGSSLRLRFWRSSRRALERFSFNFREWCRAARAGDASGGLLLFALSRHYPDSELSAPLDDVDTWRVKHILPCLYTEYTEREPWMKEVGELLDRRERIKLLALANVRRKLERRYFISDDDKWIYHVGSNVKLEDGEVDKVLAGARLPEDNVLNPGAFEPSEGGELDMTCLVFSLTNSKAQQQRIDEDFDGVQEAYAQERADRAAAEKALLKLTYMPGGLAGRGN